MWYFSEYHLGYCPVDPLRDTPSINRSVSKNSSTRDLPCCQSAPGVHSPQTTGTVDDVLLITGSVCLWQAGVVLPGLPRVVTTGIMPKTWMLYGLESPISLSSKLTCQKNWNKVWKDLGNFYGVRLSAHYPHGFFFIYIYISGRQFKTLVHYEATLW